MSFSIQQKTKILQLKSAISSYYNLQMKKIGDRQLDNYFYEHGVITGGCISSLFHNEPVNDIDVYAKTAKAMKVIKDHIINDSKNIKHDNAYKIDDHIQPDNAYKIDDHLQPGNPLVTDNAVTLTNDVQFIYLGTAELCRQKFDFVHCMPWYDIQTQKLYISEEQYLAIASKTLVPNIGGEFIKERRVEKYAIKGWNTKIIVQ